MAIDLKLGIVCHHCKMTTHNKLHNSVLHKLWAFLDLVIGQVVCLDKSSSGNIRDIA